MSKIKVLDSLTIQKIAAGEVIERPSSIVKELVENSLDANAKNIIVEIENGGKSLIRVTDDGDGIREEDLKIAFKRHSTSKLNTIDDIYSILSLGFRGEALASISSVSRVEVLTKTQEATAGIQGLIEEGKILSMDKIGCPRGTTMIIRDLFYNLPVRKKFLKSDQTETNHISDLISKLALGNPHVSFRLIKDKKTILKTSTTSELISTVHLVLGKDYSKNLIPVKYEDKYIKIDGLLPNNNLYRGNRNHQYIYINNRYIINNNISRLIENKYKTLIPIGRYPVFILNIKIKPSEVDVNIHPTKQEVKFVNPDKVYTTIENIVGSNLTSYLQAPKMILSKQVEKDNFIELPKLFEVNKEIMDENIKVHDLSNFDYDELEGLYSRNTENDIINNHTHQVTSISNEQGEYIRPKKELFDYSLEDIIPLGRIFSTYIIVKLVGHDKILFVDQHAAHERVMYEKYKKEYDNEKINSQILLVPEIIELTNKEMNDFLDNTDLFSKLGFEIEEFGPNSIALRSAPLIFGEPQVKNLFMDLIDSLGLNLKSSYDTKIDKIMKIACSNAIKSGDKIKDIQIIALFKDLMACENPLTCPHGRPTIIELSKTDIEKQFLRII